MYEWDLNPFYPSFESESFKQDGAKLFSLLDEVMAFFNHADAKTKPTWFLEETLKQQERLNMLSWKVMSFIQLRSSANTQDMEAKKAMVSMQGLYPKFALLDNKFKTYVKELPDLEEVIGKSAFLKEYAFLLKETKAELQHTMSEPLEVLTSELVQNGSSLWSQMQRHLTSTSEEELDGKKLSLTELRNLAYSPDPIMRKKAYEKELAIYEKIQEPMSFAISGIKGEVNLLGKRRYFSSPLDETLFKSRLSRPTLEALLAAMQKYLPAFRKYLLHKARLLGHEKALPWYDLFAPMGKAEKKYTVEEAQAFILKQFGTFGEELRGMAEKAFRDNWIDYLPRKGKVGGAFCSNNPALKQSRILSNFGGDIGDIITLAHELGHAYHGEQIFKEALLNSHYTMPVAETASTLCETITKRAAYRQAESKDEKIHILEQELQDSTQVIVDIYSRFLFEQAVFSAREKSIPSAKDLNEMMKDAQKASYGEALDSETLNGGMWINKSHYYRGGLSFYNFPYAFGLLFAKGIYAKYMENGSSFVEKINQLLRATGKMSCENVAKLIDIDLTKTDFWEAGLKTIAEDIDEFIELTK
ncbi:MAG: M3 family oligoendopeptidase [Bacilli bacterium]